MESLSEQNPFCAAAIAESTVMKQANSTSKTLQRQPLLLFKTCTVRNLELIITAI
jgi:hypothetical protein